MNKMENIERIKLANLAAQAAERRLNANKVLATVSKNLILLNNYLFSLKTITTDEDIELTKLRTRLEQ
jgi:hypothetical protein